MTQVNAGMNVEHSAVVTRSSSGESTLITEVVDLELVPGTSGAGSLFAAAAGRGEVAFYRFPTGFENGFHNTDVPTWMLFLSGRLEVTTSDGSTATFGPGGIAKFSDATGPGHRSRVVSTDDVVVVAARMTE